MEFELAFYTLDQAAEILQLSKATLYRRIKEGVIPRAKISGKILIPASFIKRISDPVHNDIKEENY